METLKKKEKAADILWKILLCVFAFLLAAVIVACVMETQDGLPVASMALYPLAGLLIVLVIALAGVRAEKFLKKYEKYLLPLFFLVYTVAMVRFTLHSRGIPQNDQELLILGAKYMAGLSDEMNWSYFGRWNHNIMPMIFLSIVFRIAAFFHMEDGYYLALVLNYIQVLAVLYCVYRLGYRYSGHGVVSAWLSMGMTAIFIPIWGHTQALYTDAFSFGFGIIAFYLWLHSYEKKEGKKAIFCRITAGLIWAVGFEIKATAVIPLIAVILYLAFFESGKVLLKNLLCLLPPLLLIAAVCSAYIRTLPSNDYADSWGVPPIGYFVGVGLEGNGSFDSESEYFRGVTGIGGMDEKKKFSNAFIREHLDRFLDPDHMIAKARVNFATGVMRADDFMMEAEHNGFLYNCISYQGAYGGTYRLYVTSYWYMLLEWIVIGCVLCALRRRKNRGKEDVSVFVPIVSVCGIMLYVMIFEANNRQLYNHIPMIFCSAGIGIWFLVDVIERRLQKRNAMNRQRNEGTKEYL